MNTREPTRRVLMGCVPMAYVPMARVLTTVALVAGLTSCAPKVTAVRASSEIPTTFVGVLGTVESQAVTDLPPTVEKAILQQLADHNLTATAVSSDRWADVFSRRRSTSQRGAWLVEDAGVTSGLVVLVETEVSFYAQLSGRYRWTVDVRATVTGADNFEGGSTEEFSVPVFLLYDHEREERALMEASGDIERKVGILLDGYIQSLE